MRAAQASTADAAAKSTMIVLQRSVEQRWDLPQRRDTIATESESLEHTITAFSDVTRSDTPCVSSRYYRRLYDHIDYPSQGQLLHEEACRLQISTTRSLV
jgi:hypothetical protein